VELKAETTEKVDTLPNMVAEEAAVVVQEPLAQEILTVHMAEAPYLVAAVAGAEDNLLVPLEDREDNGEH
jgi:hypothetical protein